MLMSALWQWGQCEIHIRCQLFTESTSPCLLASYYKYVMAAFSLRNLWKEMKVGTTRTCVLFNK